MWVGLKKVDFPVFATLSRYNYRTAENSAFFICPDFSIRANFRQSSLPRCSIEGLRLCASRFFNGICYFRFRYKYIKSDVIMRLGNFIASLELYQIRYNYSARFCLAIIIINYFRSFVKYFFYTLKKKNFRQAIRRRGITAPVPFLFFAIFREILPPCLFCRICRKFQKSANTTASEKGPMKALR